MIKKVSDIQYKILTISFWNRIMIKIMQVKNWLWNVERYSFVRETRHDNDNGIGAKDQLLWWLESHYLLNVADCFNFMLFGWETKQL